jgi:hypothetical protein
LATAFLAGFLFLATTFLAGLRLAATFFFAINLKLDHLIIFS